MIKSWIRTVLSFIYTSLLLIGYYYLSYFILSYATAQDGGFWSYLCIWMGIIILFSWLSEKGIELFSIPFNWLWDRTKKTRIATSTPIIPMALLTLCIPILLQNKFGVGDWIIVITWGLISIFFFYNLFLLPFINPNMGIKV